MHDQSGCVGKSIWLVDREAVYSREQCTRHQHEGYTHKWRGVTERKYDQCETRTTVSNALITSQKNAKNILFLGS